MSKRSRRLAKKNELRTVEEAIGAALGKSPGARAAESQGTGGKGTSSKAGAKPVSASKE